jgi:hypothetical protein
MTCKTTNVLYIMYTSRSETLGLSEHLDSVCTANTNLKFNVVPFCKNWWHKRGIFY